MTTSQTADQIDLQLRSIRADDLDAFVRYWNCAFATRRNFTPITEEDFRERVLTCPAFDSAGLIIAWIRDRMGESRIAGFVHAFRPPPKMAAYNRWGRHHSIGVLHVAPDYRKQGIGSQLLKAAENFLYYCPIHFVSQSTPCYGCVEGPRPPFFGSTQRMGVKTKDTELLHFLANRGYNIVDPGDISLTAELDGAQLQVPAEIEQLAPDLRMKRVDHTAPFPFTEPWDRREYSSWISGRDYPYTGLVLVDGTNELIGHLCWYPLKAASRAGIYSVWITPVVRGKGLGAFLLDHALADMRRHTHLGGLYDYAEVQSHLVRHDSAVALYESRGFQIDDAWVTLVKT